MELGNDEVRIDVVPVVFYPNEKLTYHGKLTLTNRRLVYEGSQEALRRAVGLDGAVRWPNDRSFEVDRKNIRRIEFTREGPNRKATVFLEETSLRFDFETANIDRLQASFESQFPKQVSPPSLPAKVFRVIACMFVILILSDVVGAIVASVVDVLGSVLRSFGGILILYAVWFVLGVFTGIYVHFLGREFAIGSGKDDRYSPGAVRTGLLVCALALPILAGLAWLSVLFSGDGESVYVPGNTGLSVAYFAAIAFGVTGSQYMLMSDSKPAC